MKKFSILDNWGARVQKTKSIPRFREDLVNFAEHLGFTTVTGMAVLDRPDGTTDFYSIDNTPPKYSTAYYDQSLARVDPVMQHCKHTDLPIVWDQKTYASCGAGSLWEYQAAFGFHTGIAIALHNTGGRHFFLGVDRVAKIDEPIAEIDKMVNKLKVFAAFAQETAFDIFAPESGPRVVTAPLTALEIECLHWSMDGTSTSEIADILNISCSSVNLAISTAARKLGCATKYQAVIKAIRIGILR